MPLSAKPYAAKKFAEVNGRRMAHIDAGAGDAIVFQHGKRVGAPASRGPVTDGRLVLLSHKVAIKWDANQVVAEAHFS